MLFNSFEFLFGFLPISLAVSYLILRFQRTESTHLAVVWLVLTSLFFYAWWNPRNLIIIIASILVNYSFGLLINQYTLEIHIRKTILCLGIAFNLLLIIYYKYANFLVDNINHLSGRSFSVGEIVMPLAISFFTFQQIAYLVDSYRGQTIEHDFSKYCLFVIFFPQLIAGPIVHHKDIIPQFENKLNFKITLINLSIGNFIFFVGLFKKVIFADHIAAYVEPVFSAADQNIPLTFFEGWVGALSYTFQLYFDFSGYTDMAIGIAFMFGISLPINFNSPYKALDIIDFWRRWHITLSNFLRDYIYIPLGGNRQGQIRHYGNLMTTMLLGGLWHGADWTFVFWGGLHGFYLTINHVWNSLGKRLINKSIHKKSWFQGIAWFVTFIAVIVSWVFFRATTLTAALNILGSMMGANGITLPREILTRFEFLAPLQALGFQFTGLVQATNFSGSRSVLNLVILLMIVLFAPNTRQWLGTYNPSLYQPETSESNTNKLMKRLQWQPSQVWSFINAIVAVIALLNINHVSEFLYFQF